MKLPGLRPLAAIGGRSGEISYGGQNGCIYARMESNLISPSHSFSLGQSHYRSNSSPGWQMFYYADESASGDGATAALLPSWQYLSVVLRSFTTTVQRLVRPKRSARKEGGEDNGQKMSSSPPSLPPLVYCALPRGASEMLRHDEGMPDRAGGRASEV